MKKGGKANQGQPAFVNEAYKIRIDRELEGFKSSSASEYKFPSDLTNTERRYVHEACGKMGLASKSRGKGEARYLTISRKKVSKHRDGVAGLPKLDIGPAASAMLRHYFQKYQLSDKEREQLMSAQLPVQDAFGSGDDWSLAETQGIGAFGGVEAGKDRELMFSHVSADRRKLPIWNKRDEILDAIDSSAVTIITGETGCGKSTQVAQYLLEMDSMNYNVVCTQPRRLSAVALAERVAFENGSCGGKVGELVGYSVRLDKKKE
mmetsp:Transcript_1991/g.4024  ORF Transcript_1991/g.4024 Transcript_1991/m.4024 type:complete len:263 (-) Transcript_1991:662-1450(-)